MAEQFAHCKPDFWRDTFAPRVFGIVSGAYIAPMFYRAARKAWTQANWKPHLDALTPEMMEKRDGDATPEYFKGPYDKYASRWKDTIPVDASFDPDKLANRVVRNLFYIRRDDGKISNGVGVQSGVLLVPQHFLTEEVREYVCTRKPFDGVCGNAQFKFKASMVDAYMMEPYDLALVYCPSMGDVKKMERAFPERIPTEVRTGTMWYRNKQGELEHYSMVTEEFSNMSNGTDKRFPAVKYRAEACKPGMCMSPIVANDPQSFILGFHLGGDDKHCVGVGATVTQQEIAEAVQSFMEEQGAVELPAEGAFRTQVMGCDVVGKTIAERSCTRRLEEGVPRSFRLLGSAPGVVTPTSNVVPTIIAVSVRDVMDVA